MAITLADFTKIWASTSPLTPYSFSDANYRQGWNFVGSTPPARQMWDSIQKQNDEKMQLLADNTLKTTVVTDSGLTVDSTYGSANETNISVCGKVCVLEANLKITTAPTDTFAVLDVAYRPSSPILVCVKTGGANSTDAINLLITKSGDIKPYLSTMPTTNYLVFSTTYLLP